MLAPQLRWVVAATLVMAAVMGIGRFAYTPLLPPMTDLFGWQFTQAGDIASANYLGYLLGAALAPLAANTSATRVWVAASLMLSAATTYLGAYADSFQEWWWLRFAAGIASAYALILVTARLGYVLQERGAQHLDNLHFAGVGFGILLCMGMLAVPRSVAEHWGHLGASAAALMAVAWLLLSAQPWSHDPTPANGRYALRWARLWPLVLGYGLFGYGYVYGATFVVAQAQTAFAPWPAHSVWWVVGVALVPSVYLWLRLARRWDMLRALRLAYGVEATGLLLAAWQPHWLSIWLASALLGGTFAAITALGIAAARQMAPDQSTAVIAAMTMSFALGQWLGPAISGRLTDAFAGFTLPSLSAAVALLIASALVRRP